MEESRLSQVWNQTLRSRGVSARLQPDFDPKLLFENHTQNKPNLRSNNDAQIIKKTTDFDKIVKTLQPTFMLDCLRKTLQFLNSAKTEMCFPNIGAAKEVFLYQIAHDNNNLRSYMFNDSCTHVASKILDLIRDKTDVFKWIHKYEGGRSDTSVLYYEKLYFNSSQNGADNQYKIPSTPSLPRKSLTSGLEKLTLNGQGIGPEITQDFKIKMLNTTLKYVKNDRQLTLQYPEMSQNEAEFVNSLLCPNNVEVENAGCVGFGFKSLYSPLVEEIKTLSEQYQMKISFAEASNTDAVRLVLHKIPKGQGRNSSDLNSSMESEASSETPKGSRNLPKAQRDFLSKQRLLRQLPLAFIRRSLQTILDFINDDARASIAFTDVMTAESKFLECVTGIAKTPEWHQLFDGECVALLRRIERSYRRETWKFQMDVGKTNKKTRLRNMTIFKVPISAKKISKSTSIQQSERSNQIKSERGKYPEIETITNHNYHLIDIAGTDTDTSELRDLESINYTKNLREEPSWKKNETSSQPLHVNSTSTLREREFGRDDSSSTVKNGKSEKDNASLRDRDSGSNRNPGTPPERQSSKDNNRALDPGISRNRCLSSDSRCVPAVDMSFQSAGGLAIDNTNVNESSRRDKISINLRPSGLPPMKHKILEAMSTPFECDAAERMMRLMGWDGGALGARGEGITEPIIPALHLSPGAGLGHVREQKKLEQKKFGLKFHLQFLESLLDFFHSGERERTLTYMTPLSKRDKNWSTSFVREINNRIFMDHKKEEMGLISKVMDFTLQDPKLYIVYNISADRSMAKLEKVTHTPVNPPSSKSKRKKSKPNQAKNTIQVDISPPTASNCHISSDYILSKIKYFDLQDYCYSTKAAIALACRIVFLEKIKEFLQIPDLEKEFEFDSNLNIKQRNYIDSILKMINTRNRGRLNSEIENDLYMEIKRVAGDTFLTVTFLTNKLRLRKMFYQKRFTNSALDLPPLPSQDEKNTIIYINNVPTYIDNDSNKHNDNYNDENVNNDDTDTVIDVGNYDTSTAGKGNDHNETVIDDDVMETDDNDGKAEDENSDSYVRFVQKEEVIVCDSDSCDDCGLGDTKEITHNVESYVPTRNDKINTQIFDDSKDDNDYDLSCDDLSKENTHNVESYVPTRNDKLNSQIFDDSKDDDDYDLSCDDLSKDLDISNESLLLEMLEKENNNSGDVKLYLSTDSEFEKDLKALVKAVNEADDFINKKETTCPKLHENLISDVTQIDIKQEINSVTHKNSVISAISHAGTINDIKQENTNSTIETSVSQHNNCVQKDNKQEIQFCTHENSDVSEGLTINDIKQENTNSTIETSASEHIYCSENITKEVNNNFPDAKDLYLDDITVKTDGITNHDSVKTFLNHNVKIGAVVENLEVLELIPTSSKRRSNSEDSNHQIKKTKTKSVSYVSITPKNPVEEITAEDERNIKIRITKQIDNSTFLPLLECHGIRNKGLLYGCHNEETLFWFRNVIGVENDDFKLTTVDFCEDDHYKMSMKVSFMDHVEAVFDRLQIYNRDLKVHYWKVLKVDKNPNYTIMIIEMDAHSFRFIKENDFSLFAGIDKALFSMVWD